MNRNTPLLEVSNLRVAFDGKEVVRGIDFTIQPGEKLALRSWSCRCLNRLMKSTSLKKKCASMFTDPADPGASRSTPPTLRCD